MIINRYIPSYINDLFDDLQNKDLSISAWFGSIWAVRNWVEVS